EGAGEAATRGVHECRSAKWRTARGELAYRRAWPVRRGCGFRPDFAYGEPAGRAAQRRHSREERAALYADTNRAAGESSALELRLSGDAPVGQGRCRWRARHMHRHGGVAEDFVTWLA